MPFTKITLRPGVNTQQTPLLNEAAWSQSQLVRFFQGILQKLGGWLRITSNTLTGTCRGILAWADLAGIPYVACGTEQRLQVVVSGSVYDITPVRKTDNILNAFSSSAGMSIATATDAAHGANPGDWIYIVNTMSLGGLILQGFYQITLTPDDNTWEISTAPALFTSNITNGGTAAQFTTVNGSNLVTVTLNNHDLSMGDVFTVYVSTMVGGLTLFNAYIVQSVTDANNFVIQASGGASSSDAQYENSGDIRIEYLLPTGLLSNGISMGYGLGGYGLGAYGIGGASSAKNPLRQWSLEAFGEQLLASPSYGAMYVWDPTGGTFQNPAVIIPEAPAQQTGFFLSMPAQQVVSFGCTDPNTSLPDPMLIRWCDIDDYHDWTATAVNQAGSFRLPRGSVIVGAIQAPQYGLIWTDLAVWAMQYIQPPLVYGFNEIAAGCGLIALRARCVLGTDIYWPSQNGFFHYSGGSIMPMVCTVWDYMFKNLLSSQSDKICMGANTPFNEFFTFFPSLLGNGENDSYLKYSKLDNVWDCGTLIRTAWIDQCVVGNPLGVDQNGLIQQHETGDDADGVPIVSSATSGWFKLNDGQLFVYMDRFIPDFVLNGNAIVFITIYTADYPEDTPTAYGPYTVTQAQEYIIVRSRSRLARIQISGNIDLGTFWRLGETLYMATPSGRR